MGSNNSSANMKLEPGIQALVFGLTKSEEFNGTVVTLLIHGNEDRMCIWDDWVPGDWICSHPEWETNEMFNEKNLMPIRPEEDPLEIKDVIIQKEKA